MNSVSPSPATVKPDHDAPRDYRLTYPLYFYPRFADSTATVLTGKPIRLPIDTVVDLCSAPRKRRRRHGVLFTARRALLFYIGERGTGFAFAYDGDYELAS